MYLEAREIHEARKEVSSALACSPGPPASLIEFLSSQFLHALLKRSTAPVFFFFFFKGHSKLYWIRFLGVLCTVHKSTYDI